MTGQFSAYGKYETTGVEWLGDIPRGWQLNDGKRLFLNRRELSLPEDEQLAASQQYGIVPQALMMSMNDAKVMLALKGTSSFRHLEAGDFVISLRSFEGGIEYSAYSGCVSPAYTVLAARKSIASEYYRYLFKSGPFVAALQSTTDSLRDGKSITFGQFGAIPLPIPSLEEQTQIAKFLDYQTAKIDALIEKQQQLIALLKEKRQAVISHAVTKGLNPDAPMRDSGVEWLGEVPAHWVTKRVKHLSSRIVDGPHFSPTYTDEGYMFISARNIKVDGWSLGDAKFISEQDFHEFNKRVCPEIGDVLLTKGGTTGVARAVDLDFPFQVWVHVAVLKTVQSAANPFFLAYALNGTACYEQSQIFTRGATNNDLGLTRIANITLVLPALDEQAELVEELDRRCEVVGDLIEKAEISSQLLQERRTALISAAVTGKIDVRGWKAPESAVEEEVA